MHFQNAFYNFASEIQNDDLKTRLYDNKRYIETGVGFQSEGCGEIPFYGGLSI